jgi:CRP-like cAMP-binding protein
LDGGAVTSSSVLDRLRKISFFADMPEYELRQVSDMVTERSYDAGAVIVEEFTQAERFFIIDRGKISITKRFEDGEQFVLSVQSDGDFFGEMALLDEGPRSATARAVEPTTVMEISRADFETLLYKAPALAYRILKELSTRLRETAALLVSHLQKRNRQLARSSVEAMTLVVQAVEKRDARTSGHARRVMGLCRAIGARLGLPEEELAALELGALLHDLGMLSMPESVAKKEGPLTPQENTRLREHPLRSREMIEGITFLETAAPAIISHHERFDGSGYPQGLSGQEIPLPGRILAVADAFEAMTRDRPYRKRLSVGEAAAEIAAGSGSQFDPAVVAVFRELSDSGQLSGPV